MGQVQCKPYQGGPGAAFVDKDSFKVLRACRKGDLLSLVRLVESGCDLTTVTGWLSRTTPLHISAQQGDTALLTYLASWAQQQERERESRALPTSSGLQW